jgi:hypothetical protein
VLLEIDKTTDQIKKEKLLSIIEDYPISLLEITQEKEIEFLADEYLSKYIIPQNKKLDALHVAVATVLKMDCLVSWNYKHLANINREKKIIAVNLLHNYTGSLRICTPLELIDYGALSWMIDRFETIERIGDVAVNEPFILRGLTTLPVRWTVRGVRGGGGG